MTDFQSLYNCWYANYDAKLHSLTDGKMEASLSLLLTKLSTSLVSKLIWYIEVAVEAGVNS